MTSKKTKTKQNKTEYKLTFGLKSLTVFMYLFCLLFFFFVSGLLAIAKDFLRHIAQNDNKTAK